ncbi:pre-rRNA processing protein, partial [Cryomyces antarcticus]
MSSFFITPASQRKRKRGDNATTPVPKKRNITIPNARPRSDGGASTRGRARRDDESISDSESEDEGRRRGADDRVEESSESEYEDETAAERRVRLAESYIENIRREVVDEAGFDAADVDRDNIAARLKEDVAETKGRLYHRLASDLSFDTATHTQFRADVQSYTGIATCPPYTYTVSKDMTLIKWEIPTPPTASDSDFPLTNGITTPTTVPPRPQQPRRRPKQLIFTKGNKTKAASPTYQHHTSSILCVAASADGQFVATGGQDRKLIIWAAATLNPLKVFPQHRDAVTSLAFRRGTNQLFSASADRTIKIWSLDELAYVDTLFGHQDAVVALAALGLERCVSVGARDRTARLWKVVEESQLVFRGGGSSVTRTNRGDGSSRPSSNNNNNHNRGYAEGSIDAVVLIDDETFVTGSDNGALSLWSVHKKKPLFSVAAAHGCD